MGPLSSSQTVAAPRAENATSRGELRRACLVVAEICNFATLRRYLGCACADTLAGDLAALTARGVPSSRHQAIGRDRFEIAFEADHPDVLAQVIAAIDARFDSSVLIDNELFTVELALGAAQLVFGEADEVRLAEEAEAALRDARARRTPVIREANRTLASIDTLELARDLTGAIGKGELLLQYQPKIHVRRQEVASVEALVRWRHPERGLVLPGDFIPLAEQSHDIVALTLWTVRKVLDDQRAMAAVGHPLRVFVNIAGVLLGNESFVRRVCALIGDAGGKIGFEITETSVIRDPQSAIANLIRFAEIGIAISIDDYGAGLSSLAYLKQLPASELKIDKLFVTQLASSNRDPLIVRSTIDLAHALEMEVVAEGVETPAALALLSVMGCDMVQGFLISRPVGHEALLTFLNEERHLAVQRQPVSPFGRLSTAWSRT